MRALLTLFLAAGLAAAPLRAAPVAPPSAAFALAYEFVPGDDDAGPLRPLEVSEGGLLTFTNIDILDYHTFTSQETDEFGEPIFGSTTDIGFGQTMLVDGVERLTPGAYVFVCARHTFMRGTMRVVEFAGLSRATSP